MGVRLVLFTSFLYFSCALNQLKKKDFFDTINKNEQKRVRENVLRTDRGIVPVLQINNRHRNQVFLEETLGMKTLLEEGPSVECGDWTHKDVKLILMEAPSYRTRSVSGAKKLHKIVVRIADPGEVEALLARGAAYTALYQGERGFGFEAVSPEGDCFLLHGEDSETDLTPLEEAPLFKEKEGFKGITDFVIERIWLNSSDLASCDHFYKSILLGDDRIRLRAADGEDLAAEAGTVWDLLALRFAVSPDTEWEKLEAVLPQPLFKDKKGRFILAHDPATIELWFEK